MGTKTKAQQRKKGAVNDEVARHKAEIVEAKRRKTRTFMEKTSFRTRSFGREGSLKEFMPDKNPSRDCSSSLPLLCA